MLNREKNIKPRSPANIHPQTTKPEPSTLTSNLILKLEPLPCVQCLLVFCFRNVLDVQLPIIVANTLNNL